MNWNWTKVKNFLDDAIAEGGVDHFSMKGEPARLYLSNQKGSEKRASAAAKRLPGPAHANEYRGYQVIVNPVIDVDSIEAARK